MRLRSRANKIAPRRARPTADFVEVETPTLTRSTPEGARDFLVPGRLRPGSWYALPQCPQLFKQLLMVGGLERYFQIARCYRDEDFRADRQPEFTQLDIEMSFVEQDDVIALGEAVVDRAVVRAGRPRRSRTPIPRMTYAEAMARYGSDKPDLRFGIELTELTEYFADTAVPGVPGPLRRRRRHAGRRVAAAAQARRLAGLGQAARRQAAWPTCWSARTARSTSGPGRQEPLRRRARRASPKAVGANPGDCVFFAAGSRRRPARCSAPPAARSPGGSALIDEGAWSFVWIVDAPLFERRGLDRRRRRRLGAVDRGAPRVHLADPGVDRHVRGRPGARAGLRLRPRLQRQRDRRGVHPYPPPRRAGAGVRADGPRRPRQQQEKFGFLLDAFAYGPPPHGGIAFGWDRICALLAGLDSIREVIAFPKTGGGYDPLTEAPAPITAAAAQGGGRRREPGARARRRSRRRR